MRTRKYIFSIGVLLLMASCGEKEPEPKVKIQVPLDSVETPDPNGNSQRTEAEAKAIIDGLYKRLSNGEDFAKLANQYSEDPGSNKLGGEYDGVRQGVFVPEFEKVVFNLKLNEFSTPFLTEYGYHIAKVIAIRNDEVDVRHILIQFQH